MIIINHSFHRRKQRAVMALQRAPAGSSPHPSGGAGGSLLPSTGPLSITRGRRKQEHPPRREWHQAVHRHRVPLYLREIIVLFVKRK